MLIELIKIWYLMSNIAIGWGTKADQLYVAYLIQIVLIFYKG